MAQFPIGKRMQRVEPQRSTQSIRPGVTRKESHQEETNVSSDQAPIVALKETNEIAKPRTTPSAHRPVAPRAGSFLVQTKLSTAPLAVLLPPLGDLRVLPLLANHLSTRHEAVFAGASAELDDTSDRDLRSEELMLTQVLQWLAVSAIESEE